MLSLLGLVGLALPTRAQYPIVGSTGAHDPSTLIKDGSRYYLFYTSQGLESKYSTDLRNWTYSGNSQRIFPNGPPAWTTNAVPDFTGFFWHPTSPTSTASITSIIPSRAGARSIPPSGSSRHRR
ncbi:MAG: hypothetical protein QM813_25615 [Verrucomicrobiota bacterium]